MINTSINIHDKFSVEFKVGFYTSQKENNLNEFKINSWIFVPNSLDINSYTYTQQQFYSDVKSNIRLITPIYTLEEILTEGKGPLPRLEKALNNYIKQPTEEHAEQYTYQIKMFMCIVQSALRTQTYKTKRKKKENAFNESISHLLNHIYSINSKFRTIRDKAITNRSIPKELKEYILFGDEYLSLITENTIYSLLKQIKKKPFDCFKHIDNVKDDLIDLLNYEQENIKSMGYSEPIEKEDEHNSLELIKRSLLSKFIESDLYLQRIKKPDGEFVREFYYSIAAGLAMVFATIVSFVATKEFGNFTVSLFLALVVGYMFKDKIKSTARYYFSSKLDQKYFDWKYNLSIRNQKIGWIKEAFDFVNGNKVPKEIINLRNKTPLVKAENKVYDEQVILYRKRVGILKRELEKYKEYRLSGINNIVRLNLMSFIKKMDNPTLPINIPDIENGYKVIQGNRVYALYIILECSSDEEAYYKTYRLLLNRTGIADVVEVNE
ncbi:hypothetical protein M2138_000370 [Dysgonomonadaceae bacterium PH5-43]|nr:hypothetical protein [Dysgonomonadaceae bacterium PH5-43]